MEHWRSNSVILVNTIDTFLGEVVNTNGCIDYDTIIFDTHNTFQLTSDTTIYLGGSVDLSAYGGTSYLLGQWRH